MFYDLNVPVTAYGTSVASQPKNVKGKQPQQSAPLFTPAQIAVIEARVDLLLHLGYNVIAFNQTVCKKIDPKVHIDILTPLLSQIKCRAGVVFLKRLTIVIDEDSEKGFGLSTASASVVELYDIVSLVPTSAATFSLACLTHSLPSPLTAHIISLPLTSPRLPFHLKHTLVRTALKNGAVFEINYAGALGETDARNWWPAAREVVRVTKGRGIIVSGGVLNNAEYRGPRDVQNLICLLGLAQNLAHDASTVTPKSLIIRAQTRKTYRAVLSEPKLVLPQVTDQPLVSSDPASKNADCEPSSQPSPQTISASARKASPEREKRKDRSVSDTDRPPKKKKHGT